MEHVLIVRSDGGPQNWLVEECHHTLVLTDARGCDSVWLRRGVGEGDLAPVDSPLHALSPAERRVVALVARGCTNKQIAARLLLSVRTVDAHVSHALAKCAMTSRVQLAALAARGEVGSCPDTDTWEAVEVKAGPDQRAGDVLVGR